MSLHRRIGLYLGICLLGTGQPSLHAQEFNRGPLVTHETLTRTGARRTQVVSAFERTKGPTVNIHSERNVTGSDNYSLSSVSNRVNGMGSGVVIDPRGYIVTNQHVIDDVTYLRIRLVDGTALPATVIARNPETDLALIKIDAPMPLPTMPLGTSSDLMVGETVMAIGNAFGYEHTLSMGVVSAKNRDVSLNKEMSYKSLIQTDAPINPGNSGGPLVNINGELIGVNVAIRAGAQNIGFAIPVDHMIRSVNDMLRTRRRASTYDGLFCRDKLDPSSDGLIRSVLVDRVEPGSPASQAGLKPGDQVLQVGDVKVVCCYDVERGLIDRRPSEPTQVIVRRVDREQRLELVLAAADRNIRPAASQDLLWSKLGLSLGSIPAERVTRNSPQLHGGLEVINVDADGAAAKAGIKKGDILVGLHHWETVNMDNVTYVLNHPDWASFSPLSFYILRGTQVRRGYMTTGN